MRAGSPERRLERDVEFLALLIWLLLAGPATVLAPFALTTPGSGLAAMAAFGGTAAGVLFIALGAPLWAAWVQVGFALLGIAGATFAAMQLNDGELIAGTTAEELQAGAVGLQLPFFFTVLFVALLMATEGVDPVV